MINYVVGYWQWILLIGIVLTVVLCIVNERRIQRSYPNLQEELKNSTYQLMNVRLTDHYLVVGDLRKKVIPYEDIESCEEVVGDLFFSSAGKAILLHLKNGKTIQIAKITRHYYKQEYPELQNRIRRHIHIPVNG
ncbi:hypothetical protein [Beduini massiliensis]|uniref:hypothetical protein n=1 Tax=Beduini massiliensis TaxID=1585974 RepID=UPI00059A8969|nr:hypothetical protein [Beduini massiliensis]